MKWLCPPTYWSPNPQWEGVWRWVFGEVLGLKKVMSAEPCVGSVSLKEEKETRAVFFSQLLREDTARRQLSAGHKNG